MMAEYCESCDYLEDETFDDMLDDGSRLVKLCKPCYEGITGNGKK